jgi:Raf kinase inhibitor-like YbhB/YbcL family protein
MLMAMTITSPVFRNEGAIPARHTCEGDDVSPPLMLGGVPIAAKSLALIVDDPDAPDPAAPKRVWVHWVIYNLPPTTKELPEGVRAEALPAGTRIGKNDWGNAEYGGPCPPIGRHRYFHKLYALDTVLADLNLPNKATLEKAMQGHIIGEATLMGTYQKAKGG